MKVLIVGGGQVGAYLGSLLMSNGHEIRIIENREDVFNKLIEQFPRDVLVCGSGTDPKILEKAGITSANVVAAVTGWDEINLVVSTLAKMEFGVSRVVARVNNPKNVWLYNSGMGVDIGINQADIIAHMVVQEMNINDMFTLLKLNKGKYSIVQMKVSQGASAVNRYVRDLALPGDVVLIAVTRNGSLIIPRGDTQILADDDILAFTNVDNTRVLDELFG